MPDDKPPPLMRDETTAKRHSSATKQARDSKFPHASASAPDKKKEKMTASRGDAREGSEGGAGDARERDKEREGVSDV